MSGDRARAEAVMLHGVMLNAETWADVRAALGTPTLAVDLPGLGRSASGGGTKGEWLRAVTTSLESKPVLVAHSLGAATAKNNKHEQE